MAHLDGKPSRPRDVRSRKNLQRHSRVFLAPDPAGLGPSLNLPESRARRGRAPNFPDLSVRKPFCPWRLPPPGHQDLLIGSLGSASFRTRLRHGPSSCALKKTARARLHARGDIGN